MKELGQPIADSRHSVSVSMPNWQDVIDYETGDERVQSALQCGYPRFVLHPLVEELCQVATERLGSGFERASALVFATKPAAQRCLDFLSNQPGANAEPASLIHWEATNLYVCLMTEERFPLAKAHWQHSGDLISSRTAERALIQVRSAEFPDQELDADYLQRVVQDLGAREDRESKAKLRRRLAKLSGVEDESLVYLYSSGMAAIAHSHRVVGARLPERRTIQVGFPYIDSLKLQEKYGPGVVFLPHGHSEDLRRLEELLAPGLSANENKEFCGVFTEFPSNPLLVSPDLKRLKGILAPREIPLIIDDSMATFSNHDFLPYGDVLVSSLTKYFSGSARVMGGVAILNPDSDLFPTLKPLFDRSYEDTVDPLDAAIMEQDSRDFDSRMTKVNDTTTALVRSLAQHPSVQRVFHPSVTSPDLYRACLKPNGGYGGVFSLVLEGGELAARAFYDRLDLLKGPSFGFRETLVCPYAILAHYDELEWAAEHGVSSDLIRVSVGLESVDELRGKFDAALELSC